MTNYNSLNGELVGRCAKRRKLANNTYAERRDNGAIAVRLHDTDVLTFNPDGSTIVTSGGWQTVTTKDRLNAYLPFGQRIYQEKGQWYWRTGDLPFSDGDIVQADGELKVQAGPTQEAANKRLRARIARFAKLCGEQVPLPRPNSGDCWYCSMTTEKGQSLGDAVKHREHLLSHLDEGYCVPSLVFRALREAGNTDFIISCVFADEPELRQMDASWIDLGRERVVRAVARYMRQRLGLPR